MPLFLSRIFVSLLTLIIWRVPFKRDALLTLKARYWCDRRQMPSWVRRSLDESLNLRITARAYYGSRAMTGAKGKIVTSLSCDSVHHEKLLYEECGKNCPPTYEMLIFSESRFPPGLCGFLVSIRSYNGYFRTIAKEYGSKMRQIISLSKTEQIFFREMD